VGILLAFRQEHLIWFFFVGAISTLFDIGLLWYFCEYLQFWYVTASCLSYSAGIIVSFTINKFVTFHDHTRDYLQQFAMFATISVSCLILNVGLIWLLVDAVALNYLVAKVIATVCAFFWNYYGQSRITFRENRTGTSP
jgi:putative flippase GtrA